MDINNFTIDRVTRLVYTSLSGDSVYFSLREVESPSVEFTAENTQAVDALGTPVRTYNRAKTGMMSGESSFFDIGLLAAQAGTDKMVATEAAKISAPALETLTFTNTDPVALGHAPNMPIVSANAVNADGSLGAKFTAGAAASATEFVYSASGHTITPPTGFTGDLFFVYSYDTASAVSVENTAVNFPKAGRVIMEVFGHDICDEETELYAYYIFPNAKLDPSFTLTPTTEGKHPFSFEAQQSYCDKAKRLFQLIIPGDDEEDTGIYANTVSDMKATEYIVGDQVKTRGYYAQNDSGAATYNIVETATPDNLSIIELDNGLFAELVITPSMNVMQFGAKNIDVDNYTTNDNSEASINLAINSNIQSLNFPQNGNFLIKNQLIISRDNLSLIGNNSNIITDNDFTDNPDGSDKIGFVSMRNANGIVYNGLNIIGKQNREIIRVNYQITVAYCSNIRIVNSIFRGAGAFLQRNTVADLRQGINVNHNYYLTPEYINLADNIEMTNIDLAAVWDNVHIENCEMYLSNDYNESLCFMARDVQGGGGNNLVFKNNYCEKISHDEIIAVGMINAKLSNINISDNTLVMYDGQRTHSPLALSLGSDATSEKTTGITFVNNNLFLESTFQGVRIQNVDSSTFTFKDNYFKATIGLNTSVTSYYMMVGKTADTIILNDMNEYDFSYIEGNGKDSYLFKDIDTVQSQVLVASSNVNTFFDNVKNVYNNSIKSTASVHTMSYAASNITGNILECSNATICFRCPADVSTEFDYSANDVKVLTNPGTLYCVVCNGSTITNTAKINVENNDFVLGEPTTGMYSIIAILNASLPEPAFTLATYQGNTVFDLESSPYEYYSVFNRVFGGAETYIEKL